MGAEVVEKESNRGEKGERGGQRVEGERERERERVTEGIFLGQDFFSSAYLDHETNRSIFVLFLFLLFFFLFLFRVDRTIGCISFAPFYSLCRKPSLFPFCNCIIDFGWRGGGGEIILDYFRVLSDCSRKESRKEV